MNGCLRSLIDERVLSLAELSRTKRDDEAVDVDKESTALSYNSTARADNAKAISLRKQVRPGLSPAEVDLVDRYILTDRTGFSGRRIPYEGRISTNFAGSDREERSISLPFAVHCLSDVFVAFAVAVAGGVDLCSLRFPR